MNKKILIAFIVSLIIVVNFSFKNTRNAEQYESVYSSYNLAFKNSLKSLLLQIDTSDLGNENDVLLIKNKILVARKDMKASDFWMRYLEPISYKKVNGPLPVEWETEVFEKFEKPYKREGAGLTLASVYLEEEDLSKDSLHHLIAAAIEATEVYAADSITNQLQLFSHFYFCNRLYLLNLAAIYTTGFECPNTDNVVSELRLMMAKTVNIYTAYNASYANTPLTVDYLALYQKAIDFVNRQPDDYEKFDHFSFIKDYINPLYTINQELILAYKATSKSTMDYALNKSAKTIFSKTLYDGQNVKGVYFNVIDEKALALIDRLGKLLFYDPILSGNNERSCASCHKPTEFFADTLQASSLAFNHSSHLKRNTPSLINVPYNHLIMYDGKHISLQDQTKDVILNPDEMGGVENELLAKVLSCAEYKKGFQKLLKYTPTETAITFEQIASALTFYYSKFSKASAPIDRAINNNQALDASAVNGFNLFMSKAQCATCHFLPQFNGVKPPYVGSEFEVLGTPSSIKFESLSEDKGRYLINPAKETMNAFRTGNLRNITKTAPYMHNGIFKTLNELVDFYDAGGGTGRGLDVPNQTLSSDSLHLSSVEKSNLIAFLQALDEDVPFESAPKSLPVSSRKELNNRRVGGSY
jgi:cytochrome c peroxidase